VAAVLHFAFLVTTVVLYAKANDTKAATYEFYRPAFVANTALAKSSNSTTNGTNGTNGANGTGSTLVADIQAQLVKTCPKARLKLLTMQAEFETRKIHGTWISTATSVLGVHINGYVLLILIFGISFISQVKVLYEIRAVDSTGFFESPCSARWMEYAFTSPLMISIIASCLLIRDVYTITLLSFAQGALVQFGFAIECAFAYRVLDAKATQDDSEHNAVAFLPTIVPNLVTPCLWLQKNPLPGLAQQLWYWSFVPSTVLHCGIWVVLISCFLEQQARLCTEQQEPMPTWIVAIVAGQANLFTFFALVSLYQSYTLHMIPYVQANKSATQEEIAESFKTAFFWYMLLSVVAKGQLGATYLAYVTVFPFSTPADS